MDGASLKSGAVVAVERVRNPISLARVILERSQHMMIAAAGAEQYAVEQGIGLCDPQIFVTDRELSVWSALSGKATSLGTVGAVALDVHGNLASGTSTGGTPNKYPGRVGDSALIGCGCYADNLASAVSTTGHGESIMKVVMAKTANDFVQAGHAPQEAATKAVALLAERTGGKGGLIVLDRLGQPGFAFSTRDMAFAYRTNRAGVTISGRFDNVE
jgi:beta-aspartyl-peptidase (threonine type)